MTTNKPEAVAWIWDYRGRDVITTDYSQTIDLTEPPYPAGVQPLIRFSDYQGLQAETERLQAECERWKNAASDAHQQLTADRIETEKLADYWGETMAESAAEVNDAERELETVKAECEKLRNKVWLLVELLGELVDLMEDTRQGEYIPDSFTTQPARIALAAYRKGGEK